MTMEDNLSIPPAGTSCASCQAHVSETDAFCDNCGYPLKGTEAEQQAFADNRMIKSIDLEDYNKKIRDAGTALFWIAALCIVSGGFMYLIGKNDEDKFSILLGSLIIGIIFVALGGWSRKKPLAALISGASLYALLQILNIIDNPVSLFSGIIFKVIIIGAFIKGIKAAIEADKIKKEFNIE